MSWKTDFDAKKINIKDPSPWLALYVDNSLPVYDKVKRALLKGNDSWSRRVLLPIIRPLAQLGIILVQILRFFLPEFVSSSKVLHYSIYWGLRIFATKDARYLILRHFNIGSEIHKFIADNIHGITITSTKSLKPLKLEGLIDDTFLIHDLNVYNFVFELNTKLGDKEMTKADPIDFSAISTDDFEIDLKEDGFFNFLDIQTAIEFYTPLYALFLSDHDFWRASNSLQLDEIFAIYSSKILDDVLPLTLVRNSHPIVPLPTIQAGFRLMLHGLDAEILHGLLRERKKNAAKV